MNSIEELIRERLNFIMKYIAQGCRVGYYTGRKFNPIKLTELVSFDNAIVVGTCWEDYYPITDKELGAVNSKNGMVAFLVVPEELKEYVRYQKGEPNYVQC